MLCPIVLFLLLLPAAALAADPKKPAPKPAPGCVASGRVVFAKANRDRVSDPGSVTTLHDNGAWTDVRREDGKVVETRQGCLTDAQLRDIRAKVTKLTFVRTYPRGCRGRGNFTITIDDRVVYAGNHCTELDIGSTMALFHVVHSITRP